MAADDTFIDAEVNEQFVIQVPANHSTGDSTYVYFNPEDLKLVAKNLTLTSSATRAGGVHHYTFNPLKSGTTHIVVMNERSWERKPSYPMVYKVFIENLRDRLSRRSVKPCPTQILTLQEMSHLDFNRVHIIGCIPDDLDQLIYELNSESGKSDWYTWYGNQEVLADPKIIKRLLTYMDRHNISYKYVRSNMVS